MKELMYRLIRLYPILALLMLKKRMYRIIRPNPMLALFGVIISVIGGLQVIALLKNDQRWQDLGGITTLNLAGLLGLLLILLVIVRSLLGDIWGVFSKRRIVCGSGQAGTAFDYSALLARNPKEVLVVAQNMRTLLSDVNYLSSISQWLSRNQKRKVSLTFVLSTPKALKAINPLAKEHLKESVYQLELFLTQNPERVIIRFHPGATTLSAFICDPKDKCRGILVFTPKWGLDTQPADRLYCVIERWEHDDLFNKIAGTIPAMIQNDSLSLEEVRKEFESE